MWSCFYFIPTNVIIGYETCIIIKNMFNNYLMSIKTCIARANLLVVKKGYILATESGKDNIQKKNMLELLKSGL